MQAHPWFEARYDALTAPPMGATDRHLSFLSAENEDEEMSNISKTLYMILKGCGQDTLDLESSGSSMTPDMNVSDTGTSNADEFQDYFDCTCASDEDFKPATPNLVSPSSTNPSPESASGPADAAIDGRLSVSSVTAGKKWSWLEANYVVLPETEWYLIVPSHIYIWT